MRRDSFWYHLGTQTLYEDDDTPSPWAYFVKWNKVITSVAVGNEGKIISVEGNKVIWRLADLKLLRAECRTRLNMPNAVEDLNDVRERAGLEKYDGPTGSEVLREEVFNERERELFGERATLFRHRAQWLFEPVVFGLFHAHAGGNRPGGSLFARGREGVCE